MSDSDVFWVGGVRSKGGNDRIEDKGADSLLDGWESCGDGGAMKVVWIRGVHNCVELLGPWDRLFLKLRRIFGTLEGEEVWQVKMVALGFEQQNQDVNLSNLHCTHL